jgi:hypothetical protein
VSDVAGTGAHPYLREKGVLIVGCHGVDDEPLECLARDIGGFMLCAGSARKIWWVLLAVIPSSWV